MKIAIAQVNPIVGDIKGNLEILKKTIDKLPQGNVDLVVFPELFLSGYPPRDLLVLDWFNDRLEDGIDEILTYSKTRPEMGILFGSPRRTGAYFGKGISNSALLIENGEFLFEQDKCLLPTYDVFDETRYFDPGRQDRLKVIKFHGEKLGISICEDAWNDPSFEQKPLYEFNPIDSLVELGATILINIAASPFQMHKEISRYERSKHHALKHHLPYISVGQVGANDELIFDGSSVSLNSAGELIAVLPPFEEKIEIIDTVSDGLKKEYTTLPDLESLHKALVLGLKDYLKKTGFRKVVVGLSGGIDSALVAALAVDAIGSENVLGVTMPSKFSSRGSVTDSRKLAENLGISFEMIPIKDVFTSFEDVLESSFEGLEKDVTEENLQARIRGTLLMAFSNKFNSLLLSTGNKSEIAVGYCTLYGDMNGSLSVIGDLYKTTVYRLAKYINRDRDIIPEEILTKAPSAELAPGQVDQDTLPEYEILDKVLKAYLEEGKGAGEIKSEINLPETIDWILRTVDINEYKRWQAAPCLRISSKSFGTGRRIPIAAKKS